MKVHERDSEVHRWTELSGSIAFVISFMLADLGRLKAIGMTSRDLRRALGGSGLVRRCNINNERIVVSMG